MDGDERLADALNNDIDCVKMEAIGFQVFLHIMIFVVMVIINRLECFNGLCIENFIRSRKLVILRLQYSYCDLAN